MKWAYRQFSATTIERMIDANEHERREKDRPDTLKEGLGEASPPCST